MSESVMFSLTQKRATVDTQRDQLRVLGLVPLDNTDTSDTEGLLKVSEAPDAYNELKKLVNNKQKLKKILSKVMKKYDLPRHEAISKASRLIRAGKLKI